MAALQRSDTNSVHLGDECETETRRDRRLCAGQRGWQQETRG
jgi:hypothetical protein